MFKELDETAVQTLIETLPLYPYFKPAEFLGIIEEQLVKLASIHVPIKCKQKAMMYC